MYIPDAMCAAPVYVHVTMGTVNACEILKMILLERGILSSQMTYSSILYECTNHIEVGTIEHISIVVSAMTYSNPPIFYYDLPTVDNEEIPEPLELVRQ